MNENINNAISGEVDSIQDEINNKSATEESALNNNTNFKQSLRQWVLFREIQVHTDAELERLAVFHKWRMEKTTKDKQKNTGTTAISKHEPEITNIITNHLKKQINKLV